MHDLRVRCRSIQVVVRSVVGIGLLAAPLGAQVTQRSHGLALTHVSVFDGSGRALAPNQTIVVQDSLVTAVFPTGSRTLPAGLEVLNLTGRYVIPGLIDTHVHLATDPEGEDSPARTGARLAAALRGGVTSVRDMAGDVRVLAALARNAELGEIESPTIRYVALFAGPGFFKDPRTHSSSRGAVAGALPWMRAVSSETDLRQAVAEAKGSGAAAIKLYADLDSTLTANITTEAHRQGLLVWAHATLDPATPAQVVGAGVDAVSHAALFAGTNTAAARAAKDAGAKLCGPPESAPPSFEAVIQEMVRRKTMLDATLFVYGDTPARLRLAAEVTRQALRAGVPISAGTDSLGAPNRATLPNIHQELELLVTLAGFTPVEALEAGTKNGAAMLGLGGIAGTIEPGRWADLVVLRANPVADIRNTRRIELVLKHGRIYRPSGH
jgi:imidazolonepropionase-like amidohydrolase